MRLIKWNGRIILGTKLQYCNIYYELIYNQNCKFSEELRITLVKGGFNPIQGGSERFGIGWEAFCPPPARSRKPRMAATNGKQRLPFSSLKDLQLLLIFLGQVNIEVARGYKK